MGRLILGTFAFFLAPLTVYGQQYSVPGNLNFQPELTRYFYHRENNEFTSVKPWQIDFTQTDSLRNDPAISRLPRLRTEHLLSARGPDFTIGASPLLDLTYYHQPATSDTLRRYSNGRGLLVEGALGSKVYFNTWLMENQAFFPGYINSYVRSSGVVPSGGRTKPFKTGGVDYAMAGGTILLQAVDKDFKLGLRAGHDNFFIGDGHRSLLLSDNTFNYPYLAITSGWKQRIRYLNLYTVFQTLERTPKGNAPEAVFFRKNGSMHFLSFMPAKGLELGVFEGIIWQVYDSTEKKSPPAGYYAPVIFLNTLINGFDGTNNSVIGANARYTPWRTLTFYSQFLFDGHSPGRSGYQIGLRTESIPGVKGLFLRLEYNSVTNHTYAHDPVRENYGHYNQPLAHPLGSGFNEFHAAIRWNYRDLFIGAEGITATVSDTIGGGAGSSIFIPYSGGKTTNTPEASLLNIHTYMAWRMNRKYNLMLSVGARARIYESSVIRDRDGWIYISLATSFRNRYFDF